MTSFRTITFGIVILALSLANSASAQRVTSDSVAVSGVIRSLADGSPVPRARVALAPLDRPGDTVRVVEANAAGEYRFDAVPVGRYLLTVTASGYQTTSVEAQVIAGNPLRLSVSLEPAPVSTPSDSVAVVTGRVVDAESGQPVAGVIVAAEGTALSTQTDAEGRFRIEGVPPGPQILRARMIGYSQRRIPVSVPVMGTIEQEITMAANALMLEGITVVGDAVSRAEGELGTATVIESDAIRNQTATSLRGVLELVPGVEMQPAGLDNIQQIALRVAPTSGRSAAAVGTTAETAAAFGTLIVLDGVPLSNNANLQVPGTGNEIFFTTTAGGGIDLRRIPARTIERVEVIRGVPSARYGDLTQGAIIVETRAGPVDPEIAVQIDERTAELSLVGGHAFGGPRHAGTVSLDWARTESSPGLTSDATYRFAGQFAHRLAIGQGPAGSTLDSRLLLDTRVDGFQLVDDRPNTVAIPTRTLYSRDRGFRISERARLALSRRVDLAFTGSFSLLQQRNTGATPLTRGPMPITDRLTAGRAVGSYVLGPYLAESSLQGDPSMWFGRLETQAHPTWLGADHTVKSGVEFRSEWSSGPGYQFDVENPPQVSFDGVNGFARPRSYDAIPSLVTSALYLDDRFYVPFGARGLLTVQAGIRLDLLHEGATWFSAVGDAKLGPRLNVEVSPQPWLRLRAGWGLMTKTPWLAQLHPAPQYYDVINVNWFTNDPAERLAVLTTFVEDPTNGGLGFAVAEKAEAGIEIGPGSWAVSVVAFRDQIDNAVAARGAPGFLLRDHYDLTDSTRGTGVPPDIIEPPAFSDTVPILLAVPSNIMTVTSRGFELQAVLPEIPRLRTRLYVTGQLIETRQYVDALYFGTANQFGQFALSSTTPRTPYWGPVTEVGRRALLTYRLIHHQPALGLVLTAVVQHNVFDHLEDVGAVDTLSFLGYVTRAGEMVSVPESERGNPEFTDLHIPRSGSLAVPRRVPADWMLSVQVSKTLPLNGRLSFWAFNVLDREGIVTDEGGRRLYSRMRFGLELMVPIRGLLPWIY